MKKSKKKPPTFLTSKQSRHDVLYSKARYVLNQRHIKRPWFNLNPFLERTDESVDLENYLPEDSRYIQPLESLVLCESYRSEHPVDTRELAVGSFFPYLYSAEWSDGCSVRVLEGQLLDQLLVCLYRMETKGAAIRHTTFAFAKNKRPLTGCYKLADKTAYGSIEDSTLIEFAYFAHLTKRKPNPKTQNPLAFLRQGVPDFDDDVPTPEMSPPLEDIPKRKRTMSISVDIRSINSQLPEVNLDLHRKDKDKTKQRRNSLMSKPINTVRALQAMTPKPRRMSVIDSATSSGTPMSILQGLNSDKAAPAERRLSKPKFSDTKFGGIDPKQLLKKFPVYRYVKPPRESKEKTEPEEDSTDEEEGCYGDEFYLSGGRTALNQQPETVKAKLQRKKVELQQRRRERRDAQANVKKIPDRPVLPPLPPLDLTSGACDDMAHHTIRMPDEVPTFEQFIRILKDDEYYDPRYRNKVRLKSKKIAQRYYMAKGNRRNSHMFDADSLPENLIDTCRRLSLQPRARERRRSSDAGSRAAIRLPALQESSKTLPKKSKIPDIKTSSSSYGHLTMDPADIGDEMQGITDSKRCRDHYMTHRSGSDKPKLEILAPPSSQTSVRRLSVSPLPPPFPKVPLIDEDVESMALGYDSESTDSDDETSAFDAGKLNIKYSVERLRRRQKNKKKKKPVFYDILAKYYKMQNALQAFRKGSVSREIKNAKARAKRMSLAGFLRGGNMMQMQTFKPAEEFVLGKLRKYEFLETTPKRPLNFDTLALGDFTVPCLRDFFKKLVGALDDFVVRREIVVSDLPTYYKSATSVTFTKKSCFTKIHKHC